MGVMMSRSSDSRPVPSLMKWPFGSSRGWSPQQVRDEHPSPLWGLDRHPTKRSQSRVAAQCDWFSRWGVLGVGWPCSIRVQGVDRNEW